MEGSAERSIRRWRIPRNQIQTQFLIPGDEWHPLDGGIAPEYIPPMWDGPHVGVRLVEAFKTLTAMPMRSQGGSTGFWPEVMHDWADQMAQEQSDQDLKDEAASNKNRSRGRPTAQDVSRMEHAIIWPGRYISEPTLARLVQKIALARSREVDIANVAHRLKLDPKFVRTRNRVGLDMIARCLRRDAVRVF